MKIIRSKDITTIPVSHTDPENPTAVKKVLLERKDDISGAIQMINWATLLPHKTLRPHAHKDMKEIFIILSGNPVLTIDGKKSTLNPGDMVIIAHNEQHKLYNSSSSPLTYLVIGIV
jgi:mannose-6-phosphate isomerase-like protein (cupin superfamily)